MVKWGVRTHLRQVNLVVIKRTFRGFVHLLGGLGAGVALVLIFIAWQFSQGPIPIGFLGPYIEAAVNQGNRDISLRMGETILTWAGWERALDIRVLNVQVVNQEGTTIGAIPEAAFSISGDALIQGKLAPRSIDLFGPNLRFRRDSDGNIDVGFGVQGAASGAVAFGLIDTLLDPGRQSHLLSYLARVAIIGADITFTDEVIGKSWRMLATDMRINRFIDRLKGEMSLVLDGDQRQTAFEVRAEYLTQSKRLELDLKFDQVSPSIFAKMPSVLAPFRNFEMPLGGRISLSMPIDGKVDRFGVNLTGGAGKIYLPKPFERPMDVQAIKLKASYAGHSKNGQIEKLEVQMAPGRTFALPAPISHDLPLRAFNLKGSFENDGANWKLAEFDADLNGTKISASGNVTGIGQSDAPVSVELAAGITNLSVRQFPHVWPKTLGSDPRDWVLSHISNGEVPQLDFKGRFRLGSSGELVVDDLVGTMTAKNVVVDYLPPLPAVTVDSAHMVFDESTYMIQLDQAHAHGMTVRGGTIALTGLDQYDQFADIDLKIEGAVASQLDYVNQKPLEFASALGIRPAETKGQASTQLKLFFILEKTLGWDEIQVWAQSRLRDVAMARVFMDRGINNGQLDLRVDKRGLDVSGQANFDGIPASFVWRENFTDTREFRSRYLVDARIDDVADIHELGLRLKPFSTDFIDGTIDTKLEFMVFDKVDRRLRVQADLTRAKLSAPALGWAKAKGTQGQADVTLNLAKDVVVGVPKFSIDAGDLSVMGAAKYALDGSGLERVDFTKVVCGRTNMSGSLISGSDGTWEAGFQGDSFDLSPMWEDVLSQMSSGDESGETLLDQLTLAVELKKVWLEDDMALYDVSGTFARDDDIWRTVLLKSRISNDADLEFAIRPGPDGNRSLVMRSNNAGKVLKFLDYYENMIGGEFLVTGTFDDVAPGRPLRGRIAVRDYRVVNAPVLARLLSIMALTGILDALEGDGLAFSDLSAPFELLQGVFELKEARASGTALGFTANGKIFRHADVVDLEGTVIPAYALNSAFGRIPLLGNLFSGGEKGGGIFAAAYTMTGPIEEPVVSVNPLSALAPGFLRNVFGIIGKANNEPSVLEEETVQPHLQ